MTQYAYFDSTQPAPQPVLGWYDTVAYPGQSLPPVQDLLVLTPQQWGASRTGGYWAVDGSALVQFFNPILSVAGVPQTDANGNLLLPGLVIPASAIFTPTSGSTITVPNNTAEVLIKGGSTLAALTVDLPPEPVNKQPLTLIFEIGVTSLTITPPAGYTVNSPVTGVSVGAGSRIALTLDGTLWC